MRLNTIILLAVILGVFTVREGKNNKIKILNSNQIYFLLSFFSKTFFFFLVNAAPVPDAYEGYHYHKHDHGDHYYGKYGKYKYHHKYHDNKKYHKHKYYKRDALPSPGHHHKNHNGYDNHYDGYDHYGKKY